MCNLVNPFSVACLFTRLDVGLRGLYLHLPLSEEIMYSRGGTHEILACLFVLSMLRSC